MSKRQSQTEPYCTVSGDIYTSVLCLLVLIFPRRPEGIEENVAQSPDHHA